MEKPSSWLVICYNAPSNPSKLKVRLWRDLKRIGAHYPQMSVCIVPDNRENRKSLNGIQRGIAKDLRLVMLQSKGVTEKDQQQLLQIFRIDRDRQYDEILEECQEFIDEIKLNIDNKKTFQEEVEEMEEVLDGLKRWLEKVKSIDWVDKPEASLRVENLLVKCQEAMDHFAELSQPN
jgi:hypothetical protein